MSRIHEVIRRHRACRSVLKHGIELFVVGDPDGARLHVAIRQVLGQVDENNHEIWEGFISAAKAVRWRRMTQPQPFKFIAGLNDAICRVNIEAEKISGLVNDLSGVEKVVSAADQIANSDSPVGEELLRSTVEAGVKTSVVIAANAAARVGLQAWLEAVGVQVVVASEFDRVGPGVDQSYVVGAPVLFPASLLTAPATDGITFLMPAWFGDRSVPTSKLCSFADGAVSVTANVHEIGELEPPDDVPAPPPVKDDVFFPSFAWGSRRSEAREPRSDEVEAWKLLLSGGLALWLDDGERIRSLDPRQPEGDRISYEAVSDVREGTYLVLREGATERGAMYEAALASVGPRAAEIADTQQQWKLELAKSIERLGVRRVISALEAKEMGAASRITAWIEPTLICPKQEENLAILLDWLGIPREPTYSNALELRRALYRAISELRQELEDAVAQAHISDLERDGSMRLKLERDGFRSMIVTRVLARAPFTEIIQRNQARVPFPDKGAVWLE